MFLFRKSTTVCIILFSSVVNYRRFPRQLTAAGFYFQHLTIEGYFRLLHVFLSQTTCVYSNFQMSKRIQTLILNECER